MAKKQSIDLHSMGLSFKEKDQTYILLQFNPATMTLRCRIESPGERKREVDFPFAHLPKELKQVIKPL